MKKIILSFFLLLCPIIIHAQESLVEMLLQSNYRAQNTIIRNYNEEYNIIMTYGYDTLFDYQMTTVPQSSSFYIQNISTGVVTHLFTLDNGYCVNDIQFVTLRRKNSQASDDFCCFCGTKRTIIGIIQGHALPDEPPVYMIDDSLYGFAGFFAMSDAINPNNTMSAKVRCVEGTERLFKMTCYAEQYGYYYSGQVAYRDNAVLDIIGEPKVPYHNHVSSSFSRVKFYPDYNDTTRWDNNLRFDSLEVMDNIVGTADYVVTASHFPEKDSIILRNSPKETAFYFGGMELSSVIHSLNLHSVYPYDATIPYNPSVRYELPIVLCSIPGSNTAIAAFRAIESNTNNQALNSIMAYRYNFSSYSMNLINGFYEYDNGEPSDAHVRDIIYLPELDATSIIYGTNTDSTMNASITFWPANQYDPFYNITFFTSDIVLQSSAAHDYNGGYKLFWSGINNGIWNPARILSQNIYQNSYNKSCHDSHSTKYNKCSVGHSDDTHNYTIKRRYAYKPLEHPVFVFNFNPFIVNRTTLCEK